MAERRDILKRDGCRCQRCGYKTPYGRGLVLHQIDPSKLHLVGELDALILLCEDCQSLVRLRGYRTLGEIVTKDPLLDGYSNAGKVYRVVALGVDNGWQAWVYGSKRSHDQ